MATYRVSAQELDLLYQAAAMAGDRLARQGNDAGALVMDALVDHLGTRPQTVSLNSVQREVLGKMLMNMAYDLMREDQDDMAEAAETLAERLFQDEEGDGG